MKCAWSTGSLDIAKGIWCNLYQVTPSRFRE